MSHIFKKQIPLMITSFILITVFVEYFLQVPIVVSEFVAGTQSWTVIMAAFALILAFLSLVRYHGPRVLEQSRKLADRFLSAWFLVIATITTIVGIVLDTTSAQYQFIFQKVFSPLSIAFWSIMAFYYIAAIYRSFRPKSLEAVVLLVSGFLVVTKNAPIIGAVAPWWEYLGSWIMDVPAVGGMRGLIIGVGVGVVALGIRVLLQMEERSIVGEG